MKHFNVNQTEEAYTLHPRDRTLPAYSEEKLVATPDTRGDPVYTESNDPLGVNTPTHTLQLPQEEADITLETANTSDSTLQDQAVAQTVREDEVEIKDEKQYQIIFDNVEGVYYASRLESDSSDQPIAVLFRAAKKGDYHQIWYDPNDADKVKTQKYCPQGYLPWSIPLDDTYSRIGPIVTRLKDLDRTIITRQTT